jgi:hypothetical protein
LALSLGHRRKFFVGYGEVSSGDDFMPGCIGAGPAANQPAPVVERRQVTVVFDLVGWTGLGSELDAEDLIRLLRQCRDAC